MLVGSLERTQRHPERGRHGPRSANRVPFRVTRSSRWPPSPAPIGTATKALKYFCRDRRQWTLVEGHASSCLSGATLHTVSDPTQGRSTMAAVKKAAAKRGTKAKTLSAAHKQAL